jgi:hypothetical protein
MAGHINRTPHKPLGRYYRKILLESIARTFPKPDRLPPTAHVTSNHFTGDQVAAGGLLLKAHQVAEFNIVLFKAFEILNFLAQPHELRGHFTVFPDYTSQAP